MIKLQHLIPKKINLSENFKIGKEWIVHEGTNTITTMFNTGNKMMFELDFKGFGREERDKWRKKASRTWAKLANEMYRNPDLNEIGNPVQKSWEQCFKEALELPEMQDFKQKLDRSPIFPSKMNENVNISYSAVVLNEKSHNELLQLFKSQIPDGWRIIAHHMTITMGELPYEKKQDIGKEVGLNVTDFGISDKAMAVKVKGYWTTNEIAHITLAVNVRNGGKPVDSNKITEWKPINQIIRLTGVVSEIPKKL